MRPPASSPTPERGVNGSPRITSRHRSPKVAELVAQSLASIILERNMQPGDTLPNEKTMAEMLDVGRSTLREALLLLETQGVLTIRTGPGGGPTIRRPQPNDLASSLSLLLQLLRVPFEEVISARAVIEPGSARVAAERRPAAGMAALEATYAAMVETSAEPEAFRPLYTRFHELVVEAAGNTVVAVVNSTLLQISEPVHRQVIWGTRSMAAALQNHLRFLDAIRTGDGLAAYQEGSVHVRWYRSYLERRVPHLLAQQVRWEPTA
jgi:GntR family transcriptional regulator, transcriptional repressor for pyruvate dehydrogenase complex